MLSKMMSVRVEVETFEKLKELAEASNISVSLLARKMIETGVKENWKVNIQKGTLGGTQN